MGRSEGWKESICSSTRTSSSFILKESGHSFTTALNRSSGGFTSGFDRPIRAYLSCTCGAGWVEGGRAQAEEFTRALGGVRYQKHVAVGIFSFRNVRGFAGDHVDNDASKGENIAAFVE